MNSTILTQLYREFFGAEPTKMEKLPASGSAREYWRIYNGNETYIGTINADLRENTLFIEYSKYFKERGVAVPEILCCTADNSAYIQEDLGSYMLLDILTAERQERELSKHTMSLYKKALSELLKMQFAGKGLDYSKALPRPSFDKRCIMWDLNYFKYCYLRLAAIPTDEDLLENDLEKLCSIIESQPANTFMFRDFQSRNIMVKGEDVIFIDYQGGRKGPLGYDVVSLLYDAIAEIPEAQHKELLNHYTSELQAIHPKMVDDFVKSYHHIALVRLLQAMGAFGLRGLHEKKQHFIDSIKPGSASIAKLLTTHLPGEYPELVKIFVKY